MTRARRARSTGAPALRLIQGEGRGGPAAGAGSPGTGADAPHPPAGAPGARTDAPGPDAAAPVPGQLAELWEMLTAAGVPQEALEAVGGGDPGEVMRHLADAGVLPTPEQSLDTLVDGWRPVLRPGCDPLSAELLGSAFLGMLRQALPDPDDLPALLTELVAHAATYVKPESLAMLRVLAVLAPASVRAGAAAAADRLAAAGVKDRPWVGALGRPEVGPCFAYADRLGAQESLAVSFRYGRRPHALVVLVDYDLGGGVKDCWPTDRPDRIRADYRRMAREHDLAFRDLDPAGARAVLDRALANPTCPAAPDQVESVRDHIDLLRQRVSLLPQTEPSGSGALATPARAPAPSVYRLKISLRGSKPPIWRRLEVPATISLAQLHRAIQEAFGWEDYHLWVFDTPQGEFGLPDRELGHRSAASRKLEDVARQVGARIRYTYDFGDGWVHEIVVEDVLAAEPGVAYPRCTGGRRAGPPEDCGGIWGYQELLEILADPRHHEHDSRVEWLGLRSAAEYRPTAFDPDGVNEALAGWARVLVKR